MGFKWGKLLYLDIGAQQDTLAAGLSGTTDSLRSSSYALPHGQRQGVRMREQRLLTARTRAAHQKATYVAISYVQIFHSRLYTRYPLISHHIISCRNL